MDCVRQKIRKLWGLILGGCGISFRKLTVWILLLVSAYVALGPICGYQHGMYGMWEGMGKVIYGGKSSEVTHRRYRKLESDIKNTGCVGCVASAQSESSDESNTPIPQHTHNKHKKHKKHKKKIPRCLKNYDLVHGV